MVKIGQAVRKHFSLYPEALIHGDLFTRLAFVVFGAGNLFRGQIAKGLAFLLLEIGFIFYMVTAGVEAVKGFITLGTVEQGWVFDERKGIDIMTAGDNSMLLLLYGIISLILTIGFVVIWRMNIRSAYAAQKLAEKGENVPKLRDEIGMLVDKKAHITLLLLPVMGIFIFTVLPLIYMILVAFTNYDSTHQPPGKLFDWVGFQNFTTLLRRNSPLGASFWPILEWTIFWAVIATVTCFFGRHYSGSLDQL